MSMEFLAMPDGMLEKDGRKIRAPLQWVLIDPLQKTALTERDVQRCMINRLDRR